MKVLHVNDYASHGGAEVLIAQTIDLMRERGVEGSLFTINDLPDARLTAWRYIDNRAARRALRRRLDELRPDVVHLHNFYHALSPGVLAAAADHRRAHAARIVMTAHDYHLVCPNSGGNWFRAGGRPRRIEPESLGSLTWLLTRWWDHRGPIHSSLKTAQHLWNHRLLRRARAIDAVICPSRFMQRLVAAAGLPAVHLPHPTPPVAADSSDRRGELRLVFAGRLEPEKGLEPFLAALPAAFGGRLTIVGDGSRIEACRRIVSERAMKDRVEFVGKLPHEQAMSIIARCHVLVLPSVCMENYPLSLIEALAAGTNILVNDLGGMREVVEDSGVGFRFNADDPGTLTSALDAIRSAHDAGTLNAFDAQDFLRGRDFEAHAQGLLRVYRGEPPASPP